MENYGDSPLLSTVLLAFFMLRMLCGVFPAFSGVAAASNCHLADTRGQKCATVLLLQDIKVYRPTGYPRL